MVTANPAASDKQLRCVRLVVVTDRNQVLANLAAMGENDNQVSYRHAAHLANWQSRFRTDPDEATSIVERMVTKTFELSRVNGNRFNHAAFGAWYCAEDVETAKREIMYHRQRMLDPLSKLEIEELIRTNPTIHYQEVHSVVSGRFYDLQIDKSHRDCLHEDPSIGYPLGQALAESLVG